MKAKEYFDKYFENVKTFDEITENGKAMFKDMLKEFDELEQKRNPKTTDGLVGIVRELNDKWNSIAAKVEQKFSMPVIKRNAIWNMLLSEPLPMQFPRKPD